MLACRDKMFKSKSDSDDEFEPPSSFYDETRDVVTGSTSVVYYEIIPRGLMHHIENNDEWEIDVIVPYSSYDFSATDMESDGTGVRLTFKEVLYNE